MGLGPRPAHDAPGAPGVSCQGKTPETPANLPNLFRAIHLSFPGSWLQLERLLFKLPNSAVMLDIWERSWSSQDGPGIARSVPETPKLRGNAIHFMRVVKHG